MVFLLRMSGSGTAAAPPPAPVPTLHSLAVPRVNGLLVADEWQRQRPVAGSQRLAQLGQVHPQVVGVEEPGESVEKVWI